MNLNKSADFDLKKTTFFVGPLMPLFWTYGDVSSGFKAKSLYK